jgi:hypothetical protein
MRTLLAGEISDVGGGIDNCTYVGMAAGAVGGPVAGAAAVAACAAAPGSAGGMGTYNSVAGPGPGGTQNLPSADAEWA